MRGHNVSRTRPLDRHVEDMVRSRPRGRHQGPSLGAGRIVCDARRHWGLGPERAVRRFAADGALFVRRTS